MKYCLTSIVLASALTFSGCATTKQKAGTTERDRAIEYAVREWKNHTDATIGIYRLMENGRWEEAQNALKEEMECRPETGALYNAYIDLNTGQCDESQSWLKQYLQEQTGFAVRYQDDALAGKIPNKTAEGMKGLIEKQVEKIRESLK